MSIAKYLGAMKPFDWSIAFTHLTSGSSRLQSLTQYLVTGETEDFDKFLSGEPIPDRSDVPWLDQMRSITDSGKYWVNVHVVPAVTTPYFRYIVEWWYYYWDSSGADCRFVLPSVGTSIRKKLCKDFYLLDDSEVICLDYDDDGRFLQVYYRKDDDPLEPYKEIRKVAVENSISFREFLKVVRNS